MAVATGTRVDVERFREEGYLVVEDVLDIERDLDPVVAEYTAAARRAGRALARRGQAAVDLRRPALRRSASAQSSHETGRAGYQPFDISLPFNGVTEETPIHLGPAIFRLLTNPRLLDAVEQLIGPEMLSNPIQHVRIKPPERLLPGLENATRWSARPTGTRTRAWPCPRSTRPTCSPSGCRSPTRRSRTAACASSPRSHRAGLVTHCPGRRQGSASACTSRTSSAARHFTPVPIKRGSALFLHRRTMHAVAAQRQRRHPLELRPALPADRPADRPALVPGFRRPQPPGTRRARCATGGLGRPLARGPHAPGPHPPEGKFNRWTGEEPSARPPDARAMRPGDAPGRAPGRRGARPRRASGAGPAALGPAPRRAAGERAPSGGVPDGAAGRYRPWLAGQGAKGDLDVLAVAVADDGHGHGVPRILPSRKADRSWTRGMASRQRPRSRRRHGPGRRGSSLCRRRRPGARPGRGAIRADGGHQHALGDVPREAGVAGDLGVQRDAADPHLGVLHRLPGHELWQEALDRVAGDGEADADVARRGSRWRW